MTKHKPHLPYWRYVEYADDGCVLYQCLACAKQWTGRTEPGYFRELPILEYIAVWDFCPYCGIQWKGPIKCNLENERMLGPKRLLQEKAIRARRQRAFQSGLHSEKKHCEPTWWWLIQRRLYYPDSQEKRFWECCFILNPYKHTALQVRERLQDERDRSAGVDHICISVWKYRATTIPDKNKSQFLREDY